MTKNKGKGGKNRRKGKNDTDGNKRELVFKEFGQGTKIYLMALVVLEYAQVTKMLGSGRVEVQCFDGLKRIAHIRGNMRKKVWINAGDIILVSIRDFQTDKADVILKYTPDEARALKSHGELPDSAMIHETEEGQGNDDILFELDEEDIDEI